MKKWETIKSEVVLPVDWMKILRETVKLPSGQVINDFYIWEEKAVAMVVPVLLSGKLLLAKQYKHGIREITLEFPAGYIDEAESPQEAAERELMEETGYAAKTMDELGVLTSEPGKSRGILHVFDALGLVGGQGTKFDITEGIELVELSVPEMEQAIEEGKIWASNTIACFHLFVAKNRGQKKF